MTKKMLGILGGLGPMASAQFLELVTAMTAAENDQEHLEAVLYSRPAIPDRTAYLLGKSTESPFPLLLETGRILQAMGCSVLAIPCMTAYSFYTPLQKALSAKLLHPIRETANLLKEQGILRAGILATDGTLQVGLFQEAFEACGITPILPLPFYQQEIMHIIYDDVKSGKKPDIRRFFAAADSLREQGAETVILGCTELSVIHRQEDLGKGFLDAMEVLAAAAIHACGYQTVPLQWNIT